jgi:hypothetical protein
MKRFARFWDIFYNSGSFTKTVPLLWSEGKVCEGFYAFSEWIYTQTLSTWKISLDRQIGLIHAYLCEYHDREVVEAALTHDLAQRPEKTIPFFLRQSTQEKKIKEINTVTPKRQSKRI